MQYLMSPQSPLVPDTSTVSVKDLDAKGTSLKKPVIPASFLPLGRESVRRQVDGTEVTFRVIELMREYPGVPSKLDGFESTWYTKEKIWMDAASLPTSSAPVS